VKLSVEYVESAERLGLSFNKLTVVGLGTRYGRVTNVNVILAGIDPVTLEYWASEHVLLQAAETSGYTQTAYLDSDNPNLVPGLSESLGNYIERSMRQLLTAG